jgi:type I restriction enzyme S subunit
VTEHKSISNIPGDWKVLRLGDEEVAEALFYGITAKAVDKTTKIKMLRTTDIKNYSVNWGNLPFCEITEKRADITKYFLRKGDLIVARAGTVGVSVLVDKDFDNVVFGSYLIKVRLKPKMNPKFVHYFFQSPLYWKHLQRAQGSTLKNINLPLLKSLKLPLPTTPEQEKMAEILSVVDLAVVKAGELIAKTERLKKGLMQTLLTRGIGHKESKQTPIGTIPKTWQTVPLKTVVKSYKNGIYKPNEYYDKGYPCIRMYNIVEGHINTVNATLLDVTEQELEEYGLEPGDIVVNRVNTPELVGKAGVVPRRFGKATFESKNIRVRLDNKKILPEFFLVFVQTSAYAEHVLSRAKIAVAQATITQDDLDSLLIPLPPTIDEQRKIAEFIFTIDKKLELERDEKTRLERIKNGLMDLLLTGKIRVKVD